MLIKSQLEVRLRIPGAVYTSTPANLPDPPFWFFEGLVPRLVYMCVSWIVLSSHRPMRGRGTRQTSATGKVWLLFQMETSMMATTLMARDMDRWGHQDMTLNFFVWHNHLQEYKGKWKIGAQGDISFYGKSLPIKETMLYIVCWKCSCLHCLHVGFSIYNAYDIPCNLQQSDGLILG